MSVGRLSGGVGLAVTKRGRETNEEKDGCFILFYGF